MTTYTVFFTPEATDQLVAIYHYAATSAASPEVAARYVAAVITYCEGLQTFPERGIRRDDIRPGLRITNYRKRMVIAFTVDAARVSIIGVFYGGQDHETFLQQDTPEE